MESTLPGADHHRIKSPQRSELRLPRFITVRRLAHRSGEDAVFRDDHEQRQVNRVNTFPQDPALAAALSLRFEETKGVLKMIGVDRAAEGLDWLERHAVPRIEVSHLSLADDDE